MQWQSHLQTYNWYRRFWKFWALYSIFLLAPMVLLLGTRTGRAQILLFLAAFGFSRGILSNLVVRLHRKMRPYQRFGFEPIASFWFSRRTDKLNSFPSKHVASLAAIAMMVMFFYPIIGIMGLFVSVISGMGRVILGYHYVSDVIAGLIIGVVGAVIVYYFGYPLLFTAMP